MTKHHFNESSHYYNVYDRSKGHFMDTERGNYQMPATELVPQQHLKFKKIYFYATRTLPVTLFYSFLK